MVLNGRNLHKRDRHDEKVRITMYRQKRKEKSKKLAETMRSLCKTQISTLQRTNWQTSYLRDKATTAHGLMMWLDRALQKLAADVVQRKTWK